MKSSERLFLDIHAIQVLPPSNINRDDTGSPKTAQYGGVRRARVSSQSWKKAMRDYFGEKCGVRTKRLPNYIAKSIIGIDTSIEENEALEMAKTLLDNFAKKSNGKDKKKVFPLDKDGNIKVLFFLSKRQARNLAQAAIEKKYNYNFLKESLDKDYSLDIALFGRMVAEDVDLNMDASSQVAHAISTHKIQNEFDFFTALDDFSPEDTVGAGMLGNIEFNSSTLYRYANVNVHHLREQLGDKADAIEALKLFVEAFSNSMPQGKINSFSNQTLPSALVINLRSDRPVSMVSAFEEPVKSDTGFVKKSISKLVDEFAKTEKFVKKPILSMFVAVDGSEELENIGNEKSSLEELLSNLSEELSKILD